MEIASFAKLVQEALLAGLILLDGTTAYHAPGDEDAVARYDTGTRVEILQERRRAVPGTGADESFYQVRRGSDTVWIPAQAVRILGSHEAGEGFALPFYRRAAKNADAQARALAARGLMRLSDDRESLEAWMSFQGDRDDEVRCAANESLSIRVSQGGLPKDARFDQALTDALVRVSREGGWGELAVCGLDQVLARSPHPDRTALQCLLSLRRLGDCPADARPRDRERTLDLLRQSLRHPEDWVRRNNIAQLCNAEMGDDVLRVLSGSFLAMTPEDKTAIVDYCAWQGREREAARSLLLQVTAVIGDKSQPAGLRLRALQDARERRVELHGVIRRIFSDPRDGMRQELATGFCRYREVLEAAANHGDENVFGGALLCLDRLPPPRPGPLPGEDSLAEWSTPSLAAALESIAEPERREQVERRLNCLLGLKLCPATLHADPG